MFGSSRTSNSFAGNRESPKATMRKRPGGFETPGFVEVVLVLKLCSHQGSDSVRVKSESSRHAPP